MKKKTIKSWRWLKIKPNGVCPFCGTKLHDSLFLSDACPKKGCFYMWGQAFLSPRQARRYKKILV